MFPASAINTELVLLAKLSSGSRGAGGWQTFLFKYDRRNKRTATVPVPRATSTVPAAHHPQVLLSL